MLCLGSIKCESCKSCKGCELCVVCKRDGGDATVVKCDFSAPSNVANASRPIRLAAFVAHLWATHRSAPATRAAGASSVWIEGSTAGATSGGTAETASENAAEGHGGHSSLAVIPSEASKGVQPTVDSGRGETHRPTPASWAAGTSSAGVQGVAGGGTSIVTVGNVGAGGELSPTAQAAALAGTRADADLRDQGVASDGTDNTGGGDGGDSMFRNHLLGIQKLVNVNLLLVSKDGIATAHEVYGALTRRFGNKLEFGIFRAGPNRGRLDVEISCEFLGNEKDIESVSLHANEFEDNYGWKATLERTDIKPSAWSFGEQPPHARRTCEKKSWLTQLRVLSTPACSYLYDVPVSHICTICSQVA